MTNEEVLQTLQPLIGTPYEPSVKARITELTGRLRVAGPHELMTREHDMQRITLVTDDEEVIQGFRFG